MMGFIMRYCSKLKLFTTARVFLLSLLLATSLVAKADGIEVKSAELEVVDEILVLNADLEIGLRPAIEETLNKGVPLNFVAEFEIKKPRWYWLDEVIVTAQQHIRLSYHALTRQYQLTNNAKYQNFSSLNEALRELGRLQKWHVAEKALLGEKPLAASQPLVVDKALVVGKPSADGKTPLPADKSPLVKKRDGYQAGLRMKLDLAQLPKPLQVNALASKDWNLDSEWHRWNINP
jgi:hypothetical protein